MGEILYFAYGSNMLRERLQERCASASAIGLATLPGHRLTFDKVSRDGSGKGAFESVVNGSLPGVLWSIAENELRELDDAEGKGSGYERCSVKVVLDDGRECEALAYRATALQRGRIPYDWYLALVLAGAIQQGLPRVHIDWLSAASHTVDSQLSRHTRIEAVGVLEKAGMSDVLMSLRKQG